MVKNVGMSCDFVKCLKTSGEDLRDLGKGAGMSRLVERGEKDKPWEYSFRTRRSLKE